MAKGTRVRVGKPASTDLVGLVPTHAKKPKTGGGGGEGGHNSHSLRRDAVFTSTGRTGRCGDVGWSACTEVLVLWPAPKGSFQATCTPWPLYWTATSTLCVPPSTCYRPPQVVHWVWRQAGQGGASSPVDCMHTGAPPCLCTLTRCCSLPARWLHHRQPPRPWRMDKSPPLCFTSSRRP